MLKPPKSLNGVSPGSREVFLDANVFVAAVKSPDGGSGLILTLAKEEMIRIVTVKHALREAEKNISDKFGRAFLERYYQILLDVTPRVQSITSVPLAHAGALLDAVPLKDIPILLGALVSGARFLVTLDKKHFLANERLKELFPRLAVVNPASFLAEFLRNSKRRQKT